MTALALIEEAKDIMSLVGGYPAIRLTGQSKQDVKRLVDNVKLSIIELLRVKVPDDDEIFRRLKQARRDLQRLLLQADEQEAVASARAAASRASQRGQFSSSAVSSRTSPGDGVLTAVHLGDKAIGLRDHLTEVTATNRRRTRC